MTKIVEHSQSQFEYFSGQASTVSRSLGITTVAVAWLFAGGLGSSDATPQELLDRIRSSDSLNWALLLALASLGLDFLQYVWASCAWGIVHRRLDAVIDGDDGAGPFSGHIEKAWKRAAQIGILDQLEVALGLDGEGSRSDRARVVRSALHPPQGQSLSYAVEHLLGRPAAPRAVSGVTTFLFALKLGVLLAALVALAVFLL